MPRSTGWRLSDRKLNLLVAYPYMKPDVIELVRQNEPHIRFVLDSGAFTAWKSGNPIQLDDYCRMIEGLPFRPWRYFTLDVIGDPHGTMRNYETMLARGLKPVPIFTRGEDPSVLETYYQTSDVVGIGGLVATPQNKGFVKGIMKLIAGRKVHWLGFTNLPFLKTFRPYMADSSSWEMGARFARTQVYLGGGRVTAIGKADCLGPAGAKIPAEIWGALQRLGLEPAELRDPAKWQGGYSISRRLGAASAVKLSLDVAEHLGTKLFMAAATAYASRLLLEAYTFQQRRPA